MFLIITILTIIGGGLALGLLFGSLSKIIMLAIATSVLVNVRTISELEKANYNIKRYHHQISEYNKELKNNGRNNSIKREKEEIKETKKDYSYKHEVTETKKPEVKIERFTEEDFNDEEIENKSGKSR